MHTPAERRALIVVENCYGPSDTRVWAEAASLRADGWEVTVLCQAAEGANGGGETRVIDGIVLRTFALPIATRGVQSYLREYAVAYRRIAQGMRTAWQEGPFAVVHFCNPPDIFFPLAVLYRLRGAAIIFDHHDLFPEVIRTRFQGWVGGVLHGLARVAEFLTYRSADIVLTTNRSGEQVARIRGKVPPERVYVVRNGPRVDQFVPVAPVPALKRGFRYMACYAGVMSQQDNVLEFAEIVRDVVLRQGRTDVLFALLGDGAVRAEMKERLYEWGLAEYVHMPGMLQDKLLLRRYLCTADVCLAPEQSSPLNDRSTFIKVGEYMAMAKPIVAYDLAETRYTAGEAAVYVETGNARRYAEELVALLDDPERRERMGAAGRARVVRELAWEYQERRLLAAYDTAWRRSRPARRQAAVL
jgi:glycosyltransferase involved in cell wall biosynthesis